MLQIPRCSALNTQDMQLFLVQVGQINLDEQIYVPEPFKAQIAALQSYAERPEAFDHPRILIYDFLFYAADFFAQIDCSLIHVCFHDLAKTPLIQVLITLRRYELLEIDMLEKFLLFSHHLNKLPQIFQIISSHRFLDTTLVRQIIDVLERLNDDPRKIHASRFLFATLNNLAKFDLLNPDNIQIILRNDLYAYGQLIHHLAEAHLLSPYFGQEYLDRLREPEKLTPIVSIILILVQRLRNVIWEGAKEKIMLSLMAVTEPMSLLNISKKLNASRFLTVEIFYQLCRCKDLARLEKLINLLNLPTPSSSVDSSPIPYRVEHISQLVSWFNLNIVRLIPEANSIVRNDVSKEKKLNSLFKEAMQFIQLAQGKKFICSAGDISALIRFLRDRFDVLRCQNNRYPFDNLFPFEIFNGVAEDIKWNVIVRVEYINAKSVEQYNAVCLIDSLKLPRAYYEALLKINNPLIYAKGLQLLGEKGCLTEEFEKQWLSAFFSHKNPISMAQAFFVLDKTTLSANLPENFKTIMGRPLVIKSIFSMDEPVDFLLMLEVLCEKKLLKEIHLDLTRTQSFYQAMKVLLTSALSLEVRNRLLGLLEDQENKHPEPLLLVNEVVALSEKGLLTDQFIQSHWENLSKHPKPQEIAESLALLAASQVTEQGLFDNIFHSKNPLGLVKGYLVLKNANLPQTAYHKMFSYLLTHADPEACAEAQCALYAEGLFTKLSTIDVVITKYSTQNLLDYYLNLYPQYFADVAITLHKIGQLLRKDSSLYPPALKLWKNEERYCLSFLKKSIQRFGTLNGSQIEAIFSLFKLLNTYRMTGCSYLLNNFDATTDKIIDALQLLKDNPATTKRFSALFSLMLGCKLRNPAELVSILFELESMKRFGMNEKDYSHFLYRLSDRQHGESLTKMFAVLKSAGQLTKENLFFVLGYEQPVYSNLSTFMSIHSLLEKQNMQACFIQSIPRLLVPERLGGLETSLRILCKNPYFNQQKWDRLLAVDFIPWVFLQKMDEHHLLTKATVEAFFQYLDILKNEEIRNLLGRIPETSWTAKVLTLIFAACQQPNNPVQAVIDCIRYTVVGEERPTQAGTVLNGRQSTHTASVHATGSESAHRLWTRYQTILCAAGKIEQIMVEIGQDLNRLPADYKYVIAKRSWKRMMTGSFCEFTDPLSKVTLYQLIGLFWIALHDRAVGHVPQSAANTIDFAQQKLPLALSLFVDALYELQRDGNMDTDGKDDLYPVDRLPSCASGSFNKLLEKLTGLHPDVQLLVVSKAGATTKLKHLVEVKAFEYTKAQIIATRDSGFVHPSPIVLDDNLLASIWDNIQDEIAVELFQEYGSLFPKGAQSEAFISFVACGLDHEFPANKLTQLIQIRDEQPVAGAGQKHAHDEDDEAAPPAKRALTSPVSPRFFSSAPASPRERQEELEVDQEPEKQASSKPSCDR